MYAKTACLNLGGCGVPKHYSITTFFFRLIEGFVSHLYGAGQATANAWASHSDANADGNGARDFRVLPVWHTVMMDDPVVQAYTLKFLQHGYFEVEQTRQPIVEEEKSTTNNNPTND